MYKNPENSFAAFDTQSIGEITIDNFISNKVIKRLCIDSTDLISWLIRDKIYQTHTGILNFENFKKRFFSHLFIVEDYDGDSNFQHNSITSNAQHLDKDSIVKRLKDLEGMLRVRFQNMWTSVRRAFLDLDTDQDGYVGPEDIIRHFNQAVKEINFNDLRKLMADKGSTRGGQV